MEQEEVINAILEYLNQQSMLDNVDRIILFGSRAKADAEERSDFDLAFDCPKLSQHAWLELISFLEDAPTMLKIDAIRYNTSSDELRNRIDKEGKVIYEQRESRAKF